jgi:predicted secreted hydrolase
MNKKVTPVVDLISGKYLMYPVILIMLFLSGCQPDSSSAPSQLVAADIPAAGFLRADGSDTLTFPEDHGAHLDYQTEWWYFTGNLETDAGRHFGYQLTFFRRALIPDSDRPKRESAWAADQVYMAHFALTDVEGSEFNSFERFTRGSTNLAGVMADPFAVWLEDWSVEEIESGVYQMRASQEGLKLDLRLIDSKGPVLHGDRGYSQKGPETGDASYYYSLTRLESSGTVQISEDIFQVNGESWMDHEYSTSALSEGQIGWDWFSIQLDDNSELMVFQIRQADGSVDAYSSGTWIAPDGSVTKLAREEFRIEVEDTWRSPHSGAVYPSTWSIGVPELGLNLHLEPFLADQELNLSYSYWEGAVRVQGSRMGTQVNGHGYVEMTGYAGSMQGQF